MKKALFILMAAIFFFVTACASSTSNTPSAAGGSTPTASGSSGSGDGGSAGSTEPGEERYKATLEFYMHSNDATNILFQDLVDQYNAENGYATVNYNIVPHDDFFTKLAVLFSSKSPVDLINIHNSYIAPYVSMLEVAPEYVYNDIRNNAPASYEITQINGNLYGYSYPDVTMLFVNLDLLAEAGFSDKMPETWDDWLLINERLDKTFEVDGVNVRQVGLNHWFGAANPLFNAPTYNNVLESLGGKWLDDDGRFVLGTTYKDVAIEALELYEKFCYQDLSPFTEFAAGHTAALPCCKWVVAWINTNGVEGLNYTMLPMPKDTSGNPLGQGYFQMMVVPNYMPDENRAESWRFNQWLHNDDNNYRIETEAGCGDWRLSTIERLEQEGNTILSTGLSMGQYASVPFVHKDYSSIERIVGDYLEQFIFGTMTAEEAVDGMQSELNDVTN